MKSHQVHSSYLSDFSDLPSNLLLEERPLLELPQNWDGSSQNSPLQAFSPFDCPVHLCHRLLNLLICVNACQPGFQRHRKDLMVWGTIFQLEHLRPLSIVHKETRGSTSKPLHATWHNDNDTTMALLCMHLDGTILLWAPISIKRFFPFHSLPGCLPFS